jgi:hypothetical protein
MPDHAGFEVMHLRFRSDEIAKVRAVVNKRLEAYRKSPRTTAKPTLTDFVVLAAVERANAELAQGAVE